MPVLVEYPTPEIFVPHARSGARPVAALAPGAPALLCPGTHAARPRDAASASMPQCRAALANQDRSPPPLPPPQQPPPTRAASEPSARAGSDAWSPGAPPFPPRAPPRPVFRPRAPPPPRRSLSVSRCPSTPSPAVRLPLAPELTHLPGPRPLPPPLSVPLPPPPPSGPRLCRVAGASAAASPPPPRQDGHRRGR